MNKVFIKFSPSPTHLLAKLDADILKKVELVSEAIALPNIVLPVPGGPYNNKPLGAARNPVKISGRFSGCTIDSTIVALTNFRPAISSHFISGSCDCIWLSIAKINFISIFFSLSSLTYLLIFSG
jgi:hypothetical protein